MVLVTLNSWTLAFTASLASLGRSPLPLLPHLTPDEHLRPDVPKVPKSFSLYTQQQDLI